MRVLTRRLICICQNSKLICLILTVLKSRANEKLFIIRIHVIQKKSKDWAFRIRIYHRSYIKIWGNIAYAFKYVLVILSICDFEYFLFVHLWPLSRFWFTADQNKHMLFCTWRIVISRWNTNWFEMPLQALIKSKSQSIFYQGRVPRAPIACRE